MPEGLPEEQEKTWVTACKRIVLWLLVVFVILCVLAVIAAFPVGERLMVGWLHHSRELWQELRAHWRAALVPLGCLVGFVVLVQLLLSFLKSRGHGKAWKQAHISSLAMLLLLGLAAAITVSSIVREMLWVSEAATLHEDWSEDSHLVEVLSAGAQISERIESFKKIEGRYPEVFEDLHLLRAVRLAEGKAYEAMPGENPDYHRGYRWQGGKANSVRESYIYLKPATGKGMGKEVPMLISPMLVRQGVFVVFYQEGDHGLVGTEQLDEILQEAGIGGGDE